MFVVIVLEALLQGMTHGHDPEWGIRPLNTGKDLSSEYTASVYSMKLLADTANFFLCDGTGGAG